MPRVLDFQTPPYYAQIALFDPSVPDAYPQWSTGTEEAMVGPHGIVVATRPDDLGDVEIEVWVGAYTPGPQMRPVAEGMIEASEGGLVVGSVTGNDLRKVPVAAGKHHVAAFVSDGEGGPESVVFAVV
jgi:hypothetical protein